ncbi:MAG TPA: PQQ-dependent sugar dehydrogenase [Candidatus Limnocylindrales bacterium]|nr:PQQ-dependent sugar dehydrogenase [Candidatus Limnocylindrales bacterium]
MSALMAGVLVVAACGPAGQQTPSPGLPRTAGTPTEAPDQPGETTRPTPPPAGPSPAVSITAPTDPALPTTAPVTPVRAPAITFEVVADGFDNLTFLTHAGDGSGLIYVVEQRGIIHVGTPDGVFREDPFLDISDRVSFAGERGLLGLAFHPAFDENRRFFVNYSARDGANVVAELRAGATVDDPAEAASERVLLRIEQPFPNHNGGMLAFGPEGMLYISSGDGGGAGDPLEAGQDRTTLLGKVLRVDVDADPYGIPADNPFAGGADGARPEIWAYGLRNPWRISFDRRTGALFIADVGQDRFEEINVEPSGVGGGRNYGWNVMEGPACFGQSDCDSSGMVPPIAWYQTGSDCAVTGGYVYRGGEVGDLAGFYLFSDYCSGTVWALDAEHALRATELPVPVHEVGRSDINVTSFGEDEAGEVYLLGAGGQVLRVVAAD